MKQLNCVINFFQPHLMIYVCVRRFDVIDIVENFLGTKHDLIIISTKLKEPTSLEWWRWIHFLQRPRSTQTDEISRGTHWSSPVSQLVRITRINIESQAIGPNLIRSFDPSSNARLAGSWFCRPSVGILSLPPKLSCHARAWMMRRPERTDHSSGSKRRRFVACYVCKLRSADVLQLI